ncbi:aldo/keto reductase [Streptomyces coffeae]|uniref:aldo/keto reductase n=1 Tax=Streptomyces coffeae TaxID=621382 RepID=UPI0027DD150C|nr:aldo/keto reductase [Streptomyces coffeae]
MEWEIAPACASEAYDRRGRVERTWDVVDTVRAVAGERDVSMAQVALAWVLARPGVSSVILGARTVRPGPADRSYGPVR